MIQLFAVDIEDLICEDVDLEVSHEDIDLEVSHEELNALLVELLADDFNDPLKNNKQSENEEVDAAIEVFIDILLFTSIIIIYKQFVGNAN